MFEEINLCNLKHPVGIPASEVSLRQVVNSRIGQIAVHAAGKTLGQLPAELGQLADEALLKLSITAVEVAKQKI